MYSQPREKVGFYVERLECRPGEIGGFKGSVGQNAGFISDVILCAPATDTPLDSVPPEAEAAAVAARTNGVRW